MRIPSEGARVRGVLVVLAAAVLAGCGGGASSGSSDAPVPSTPPPASPSLSLSQTSVAVSGATGAAAPASVNIQLTVANAPSSTLTSTVTLSGDSVAAAGASWQSNGAGVLTIAFAPPGQLGAGNYTQNVTLNVCTDTACAHPIAGSPAKVTVTYAVTGSVLQPVSFYFPHPSSGFQATTSDTSPETTNFTFYIRNVPPAGLFVLVTQPKGGFVTGLTDTVEPDTAGELVATLALTLQSPASLGSGFFNSSVSVAICYDQACSKPVAGSPLMVPIQYTVYLTQGKEYSLVSSNVGGISDLAYDSSRGSLYVTGLAGYNSNYSSAVSEVNPATGNAVAQLSLNDGLSHVAVSDDGQYVYAASNMNSSIYRLALPALTTDITIDLGNASTDEGAEANIAGGMAVAPGAAHSLVVALAHSSGPSQSQGVAIFDDGTERAQVLSPLSVYTHADSIAWGANSGTLYVSRESDQPVDWEIDTLSVDPSGVTLASSVNLTGTPDSSGSIVYASGKLYESTGFVRDATSLSVLDQVALPPSTSSPSPYVILCLTPDIANNRLFVLSNDGQSSHLLLLIYALPALTLQGAIDLGFDSFDVSIQTHLILWGTQGIAFNRNGLQILSGSFSAPRSGSTTPTSTAAVARRATRQPLHSFFIAGPANPRL
jgi:hypothetical protein